MCYNSYLFFRDDDVTKFTVVAGSVSLTKGGEVHQVDKITYHDKYSPETMHNDIAVIKVIFVNIKYITS